MATVDEILARQAYADGDETWTKDNNYPSYTLYVEPECVPVTNKRIADFNDQISVRGEQNAQFVGFQLPRYDDGLDLTAQHLYIHYQTVYGGGDGVPCNVSKSDSHVRMCWQVPAQATQEPGAIQMMIYATGANSAGERVTWKTLPASYTIHDGLEIGGGIPEPDQSWYEQFVAQMEGRVSTAQGYANDAQASKTAAASSATASAQSATASAKALEDNKAYVESQKAAFVGYNKRETDLKYANAIIGSASDTTQVTVDDAWEAPIPGLEIAGKSEQGADPSPDNPQEIVSTDVMAVMVTGAQVIPYPYRNTTKTSDGITFTDMGNGGIKVTGTSTKQYITFILNKNLFLPPGIYTKNVAEEFGLAFQINRYINNEYQATVVEPDNKTFDTSSWDYNKYEYMVSIQVQQPDLTFNTIFYPMINRGDTALPWEPYQSKTAAITLAEPLRGIEDVRDRIMCRDGVWGIERKHVPLTFDGSEDEGWRIGTDGKRNITSAYNKVIKAEIKSNVPIRILCDTLKPGSSSDAYNLKECIASSIASVISIYMDNFSSGDVAAFKAFLADHPITAIFERAVPTWTPLPADTQAALNALTAYTGRTTITVTAEGPEPDVAVEYIADTKTYIANEHAKMQASFDRQISAILALLPTETQAAMINNETSALLAESEV